MEPNTGKQRTPVFQLLYMTDSFSEGRVEEILNYLRNQDKQRQEAIGNYMINVLKQSAKEKNDSELGSQISDLIEQIKKILSEEKSNEGTQKRLGSKPTPKPLP